MFGKIRRTLRSGGVAGLLRAARETLLPPRLADFGHYKPGFELRTGLEIGGPSDIFRPRGIAPVYPLAGRVDNCNFGPQTVWEGKLSTGNTFRFDPKKAPGVQYITEASDLCDIDDATYDFLLSSHCIEHLANPLKGLSEWMRVLKQDGLCILVIPHKEDTFDHRRPVTTLAHLIEDFENGTDESDLTHLEEILRLHDLARDPEAGDYAVFEQRSRRNAENRCLHHHVFDTSLAVEVVDYMGLQILAVERFRPYHIVVVARKAGPDLKVDNHRFQGDE